MFFTPNFFNNIETLAALAHHTRHLETKYKKTLYIGKLVTVLAFTDLKESTAVNQCFDTDQKPLSYPTLAPHLGLAAVISDKKDGIHVLAVYTLKAMQNIYCNAQREKAKVKWRVLEILPETMSYIQPKQAKEDDHLNPLSLKRGFLLKS